MAAAWTPLFWDLDDFLRPTSSPVGQRPPEGNTVFTSLATGCSNYPLLLLAVTALAANDEARTRESLLTLLQLIIPLIVFYALLYHC